MGKSSNRSSTHARATAFLLPAFFAPTSNLRAAFHRLRGVLVGPGTEIGYEVLIDNLYPEMVQIGRDVTIAARATILAHDDAMAYAWGRPEVVRPTRIEDRAFIGVGATILAGVTIGARSIVGAGSVVVEDVEPDSVVAGVPARLVRKRDGP